MNSAVRGNNQLTDSDYNPSCPLILPEMASVFHSLAQILCGEEEEPGPKRGSAEQTPRCAADLASMVQESRLSEGLKRPFGAHREPVRTSHLKKRAGDLAPG